MPEILFYPSTSPHNYPSGFFFFFSPEQPQKDGYHLEGKHGKNGVEWNVCGFCGEGRGERI